MHAKFSIFSANILGKNWIRLKDGTAFEDEDELVITTTNVVTEGDIITVQGKVEVDQDFGYGYMYEVMVREASVKVEAASDRETR